ncbi:MAG: GNAT family N-acetyltransferase [Anaerolineae bacterium]|nr:GNAT family N-acetyltransferase [Anaerolineae bacterium]
MEIKTKNEEHEHIREMWLDADTRVSRLAVIDYSMRIGSIQVNMAGIGGVETHYQHRMKGYMRTLFEDTVHYMMDGDYEVSMLFGIENFYTKFGYASALATSQFTIKTRDAEVAAERAGKYSSRPIQPDDMPAVLALYNANNAGCTGSIVRTVENFAEFRKGTWYGTPAETALWEDQAGELLGYMVWDKYPKGVKVAELEAREAALFPAMLSALAEQAITKRCESITVFMPPDHPFGEFAQRYGIEWTLTYPRYGSGMMRILNQKPLFGKLIPELEQRLAASSLAGYSGAFDFRTDLGVTSLTFENGALTVGETATSKFLALSQDKLMQLIVGYRSVRDVCNDAGVQMAGAIEPLLQVLFPKTFAYPWLADHF